MRKYFCLPIVVVVSLVGCQNNVLEVPVDCSVVQLTLSANIVNTDCGQANGSIEVMVAGGEGPYTYSINGGPREDAPLFTGLSAGEYAIQATDKNGCSVEETALVANKNGLSVTATTQNADCGLANGLLSIAASNGVEPYTYQLDNNPVQQTPEFTVAPGVYQVVVTDAIGCEYNLTQQVFSNTSYQTDISPIIMSSCVIAGCHDGSVSSLPNFSNFSEVQANAAEIRSRTQSRNMPRTGSLTQAQIDLIACWVDDGAQNN